MAKAHLAVTLRDPRDVTLWTLMAPATIRNILIMSHLKMFQDHVISCYNLPYIVTNIYIYLFRNFAYNQELIIHISNPESRGKEGGTVQMVGVIGTHFRVENISYAYL